MSADTVVPELLDVAVVDKEAVHRMVAAQGRTPQPAGQWVEDAPWGTDVDADAQCSSRLPAAATAGRMMVFREDKASRARPAVGVHIADTSAHQLPAALPAVQP